MARSAELKMKKYDGPPSDDVCPICFGEFETPCETNCGHWFCGSCILLLWSYRGAFRQCKCPICCSPINKLVPEPSLFLQQEEEVMELLKRVKHYNCLYGGGLRGLSLKVKALLLLIIKCLYRAVRNPDNITFTVRSFAILLTVLYDGCGFNFITTGGLPTQRVFDYCAIILGFLFCVYRIFYR
ncbi:hypothetical protein M9H77_20884 [Catharanthus roseus]|uniref:Uncharacterized protein n=1 Tax=Catharanthus roseus TaxID=4058 RepID=A0ACC0APZ8_CATRO|nr:hypothetical protein M9H77_20884 [Catharanthus roseus]